MNKKYPCPHHEEKTPSAVAYANGYYSFCCGKSGPLSELGLAPGERVEITYVEDLPSSIDRIKRLERKEVRGFSLPVDSTGYYLLFPGDTYYKKRILGADSGSKYRGPSGHKKPPFVAYMPTPESWHDLILVEGEFNALSLALLEPNATVISPGGAGDFYSARGINNLEGYSQNYTGIIHVVVDADAAGAQAAIETKARLITLGCSDVRLYLVEKDFNDILVELGKEALRDEVKRLGIL